MSTVESMHHRPVRGGIERDAFSPASIRALTWNHGARAKVKTAHVRRVRRSTRQALRAGREV
jgi:hypothetical protein